MQEGCSPGADGCLPAAPENFFSINDGFVFRLGANYRFPSGAPDEASERSWGAAAEPAAPYDWSGVYVGGHLGWGGLATDGLFNSANSPILNPFLEPHLVTSLTGINKLGVLGGAQIGLNYQLGSVVFGVEGDISAVDWDGSESKFNDPSAVTKFTSDYMATLRGRIGWADDNALFYLTGGLAFVDAELDNTPEGGVTKSVDALGGAVGAGMEWGVTSELSVKVEGLYLFFNQQTDIAGLGPDGDAGDIFRMDDGFVIRVGANWRLLPFQGTAVAAHPMRGVAAAMGFADADDQDGETSPWTLSGSLTTRCSSRMTATRPESIPLDNSIDRHHSRRRI